MLSYAGVGSTPLSDINVYELKVDYFFGDDA